MTPSGRVRTRRLAASPYVYGLHRHGSEFVVLSRRCALPVGSSDIRHLGSTVVHPEAPGVSGDDGGRYTSIAEGGEHQSFCVDPLINTSRITGRLAHGRIQTTPVFGSM